MERRRGDFVFGLAMALCGALAAGEAPAPLTFRRVEIDARPPRNPYIKLAGDFDKDGRLDIAIAGAGGPLVLYSNPRWQKVQIAAGGWQTVAGAVGDVDGDGDLDIVPGSQIWLENPLPGGDPFKTPWTVHRIGNVRSHDALLADLDRDGRLDIVSRDQSGFGRKTGNRIHLWRQAAKDRWEHHELECPHGEGVALADIDGDGDADIIIAGCWYENPGRVSADWTRHEYTAQWTWADAKVAVGDINGDGRPDIVLSPAEYKGQTYRIAWYESPRDPRQKDWKEHVIAAQIEAVVHGLALADMDGDGRPDVIAARMHQGAPPQEVAVYLNADRGTRWQKVPVATTGSHDILVADFDGDGRPDILGANHSGPHDAVELWLNEVRSRGAEAR